MTFSTVLRPIRQRINSISPLSRQDAEYLQLLATHREGASRDYRKFMVLTTARSGSSWTLELLSRHPDMQLLGEIFHPKAIHSGRAIGESSRSAKVIARREREPVRFLQEYVFRSYASDVQAVGFKMFYEHIDRLASRGLRQGLIDDQGLAIIHLVRKNLLSIYVSNKIASQAKRWEARTSQETIQIDVNECTNFFAKTLHRRKEYVDLFQGHALFELGYEDLVADSEGQIAKAWEFLGLRPVEIEKEQSELKHTKQERRKMSGIIANYSEVQDAFQGTPYEAFLGE